MSTRARRGNHTPVDTPTTFNTTETLILAQAVWEYGASSWQTVAKVLAKHPLISRPKPFFTAQSCHTTYDTLMKEAGLDQTEANNAVHAPMNHKLAEKHFRTRFEELRGLIIAEETQFKKIVSEIEQIRASRWGIEITTKATGVPKRKPELLIEPEEPPVTKGSASQEKALQTLRAEVFDGSDLSGTTDTPSSSKSQDDSESKDPVRDSEVEAAENQEEGRERTTEPTVSIPGVVADPQRSQVVSPIQIDLEAEVRSPDEEDDTQDLVDEQPLQAPLSTIVDSNRRTREASSTGDLESQGKAPVFRMDDGEEEEGETKDRVGEEEVGGVEERDVHQKEKTNKRRLTHIDEDKARIAETPLETEPILDVVESTSRKSFIQEPEPKVEVDENKLISNREAEAVASPERTAEEDAATSGDEPLQATRRSTRRRSSAHLQPMRTVKSRRQKRVSTEAAASPPATLDEEIEVDPSPDANDTDALSEGHPVDGDDEGSSSVFHESSAAPRRRDAKRKAFAVENIDSPREKKRARDDSEPADEDETGINSNSRIRRRGDRTEEQAALKRFQNVIIMLHTQISQHRNGNIFHNPIKTSEAPDYHEIVKQPTDLKKIKIKIKDGTISNSLEFKREIFHMFANAMMYNRPGSDVYVMAEDMMLESEVQIETFRQTEGLVRGVHRI